jgi:deoxyribonuclease (pyrimidine dimer)
VPKTPYGEHETSVGKPRWYEEHLVEKLKSPLFFCYKFYTGGSNMRANLVPVTELKNRHLGAEHTELLMLVGMLKRTLSSRRGYDPSRVPERFTLNKGHAYFFYNKGKWVHRRWSKVREEMRRRGFNLDPGVHFPVEEWPPDLYNDWAPRDDDVKISRERIELRISQKPWLYKE